MAELRVFSEAEAECQVAIVRFDITVGPVLVWSTLPANSAASSSELATAIQERLPNFVLPEGASSRRPVAKTMVQIKFENETRFVLPVGDNGRIMFGFSVYVVVGAGSDHRGASQFALCLLTRAPPIDGVLLQAKLRSMVAVFVRAQLTARAAQAEEGDRRAEKSGQVDDTDGDTAADAPRGGPAGCAASGNLVDPLSEEGTKVLWSLRDSVEHDQKYASGAGAASVEGSVPVRMLVMFLARSRQLMPLLKLVLLEGRIMMFSSSAATASNAVWALASLLPGSLSVGLGYKTPETQVFSFRWAQYGLPFDLWTQDFVLAPLVPLAHASSMLTGSSGGGSGGGSGGASGYLAGTTNAVVPTLPQVKPDALVDLDKFTVTPFDSVKSRAAFDSDFGLSLNAVLKAESLSAGLQAVQSAGASMGVGGGHDSAFAGELAEILDEFAARSAEDQLARWEGSDGWIHGQIQEYLEELLEATDDALVDMQEHTDNDTRNDDKRADEATGGGDGAASDGGDGMFSNDDEASTGRPSSGSSFPMFKSFTGSNWFRNQAPPSTAPSPNSPTSTVGDWLRSNAPASAVALASSVASVGSGVGAHVGVGRPRPPPSLAQVLGGAYGHSWVSQWQATRNYSQWRLGHVERVRARALLRAKQESETPPEEGTHPTFVYPDTGDRYTGEWHRGFRHGQGVFMEQATGNRYDGEWVDGLRHGNGVLTTGTNDFIYDGSWVRDERCGFGHCVLHGRESYTGHWLDGAFHGAGTLVLAGGEIFEGEFVRGKKNGVGTFTKPPPTATAGESGGKGGAADGEQGDDEGDSGCAVDRRLRLWPTGDSAPGASAGDCTHRGGGADTETVGADEPPWTRYVGEWVSDKREGVGTCHYANSIKYSGHWASGKPHGEGTAVDAKTGNRWEGQWKEGRRHGEGTVYWGNGNEREGTWREGVAMAGEWRIRWANGDTYMGQASSAGLAHGEGTKKYQSGVSGALMGGVYTGQWLDGKRSGHGVCLYADGATHEGEWADDRPIQSLKFEDISLSDEAQDGWNRIRAAGEADWSRPPPAESVDNMAVSSPSPPPQDGYATYVEPATGDLYEGDYLNGARHGHGRYVEAASSSTYEGQWVHDKRHGTGKLTIVSGDGGAEQTPEIVYEYEGEWKDDAKHGQGSSIDRRAGAHYEYSGGWGSGKFHGHGRYRSLDADGTIEAYDGEHVAGLRSGVGTLQLRSPATPPAPPSPPPSTTRNGADGGDDTPDLSLALGLRGLGVSWSSYTGEFLDGVIAGVGTAKGDGWTYSGQWRMGDWHGDGTLKWDAPLDDALNSTASFPQDPPAAAEAAAAAAAVAAVAVAAAVAASGQDFGGRPCDASGTDGAAKAYRAGRSHQGTWVNGVAHGHGVSTTFRGAASAAGEAKCETYECEWRDGWALDGEWSIRFFNGDQFVGECVGGRPHGEGMLKSGDGEVYTGSFENGKRHGHGTSVGRTGEVYQGMWVNGRIATGGSEGTLQMADGTIHMFQGEIAEEAASD